ncbi:AI-2E family transporter [Paenibacillus sp. MMS18-CY102]|uniref:AI-2E family transporter n=1 Tax=Paenibacillus sp. MMS18-CY102 TaxID=2682849 RepID=UPI001920E537|nr:AI-2E family transporter [Paenibacillus sp. MMS18-CY102]
MPTRSWSNRFRFLFLNNRFVLSLLVLLLIGINILVLSRISFIFTPFIVLAKTVLLPLLLTGVVYYLLKPIVDWLVKLRLKRVYAILLVYIVIIAVIALVILAVIPLIRQQITSLVTNFPSYSDQMEVQFREWIGSDFFNQLEQATGLNQMDLTDELTRRVTSVLTNTWQHLGGWLGAVTELILAIVTVPFVLFYLLKDGHKLSEVILWFIPTALRPETRRVLHESNRQISSYIRGQIIISICIGALLYIGYLIIGLEYSLVLAIAAACTSVVPYLGPVIAITPALIVATVTSPTMLLKMIAVWTIVQLIEGKFISPQIMGKTLRIHPVTIIFVILTAGNLFGVLGIILAVPGYAVLKVISTHIFRWFMVRSGLYGPEADLDLEPPK